MIVSLYFSFSRAKIKNSSTINSLCVSQIYSDLPQNEWSSFNIMPVWSQIIVSSCLSPRYLGIIVCLTADTWCWGFAWISGGPLCCVSPPLSASSAGYEHRAEYAYTKQVIHCWAEIVIYCWYSNKELSPDQKTNLTCPLMWTGKGLIKKKKKRLPLERSTVGIKKAQRPAHQWSTLGFPGLLWKADIPDCFLSCKCIAGLSLGVRKLLGFYHAAAYLGLLWLETQVVQTGTLLSYFNTAPFSHQ